MMNIAPAALLGLSMFLAAACSDPSDSMHGWLGRDRSELIRIWGNFQKKPT